MATDLIHFAHDESVTMRSVVQDHTSHTFKPSGLWVSVEGPESYGWSDWREAESYGIGANRFRVELAAGAGILTLATVEDVRRFDAEYAGRRDRYEVDWARLAESYQGIVIAPYQWSLRLSDVRWYYPWDCASGCIWDANAVASIVRQAGTAVAS